MTTFLVVAVFTLPGWGTMLYAIILEVNNYIECYKFDKNNPDS